MTLRLVALALLALSAVPTTAQVIGRAEGREATPGGYFINARAGEPTTRVYVWGSVRNPGVYEVGSGFDVRSVLSLAGLPIETEQAPGDLEARIQVFRPGAGAEPIYTAPLSQFVLQPEAHPALREGDVLTVGFEPAARVNVWGAVRLPGLYEVGPGFDVQAILSLAGGPLLPPLQDNVNREVVIRYTRGSGLLFDGPLEEFTRAARTLPMPQDGDIIEVVSRERRGFTARDALTVLGSAAGIVSAIIVTVTALR